jgi:transcriptional regulator of acetoin/glycerol metabolism
MNHLPSSSLIHSRHARVELARQRFFDDGQSPTGIVGEAVFESWARCLRLHGSPRRRAAFEPVTASRTQLALLKNRQLREAWMHELPRLESMLGTTNCAAMLTDSAGVLIGSSCVGRAHEELMPLATRLGVNLSEDAVGTTAPGVAARTGRAVCVLGGEHFFESVKDMHCAAAPIRDIRGLLAGVLDISSEGMPFEFDAAAVAGLYAGAIENRLLVAQSTEHLVVRFQIAPELLDSAMVGLVGIDSSGRLAWTNGVGRSLLGDPSQSTPTTARLADERLGFEWQRLAALPSAGAVPVVLPNGLSVWARAEMCAPDGRRGLVAGGGATATVSTPATGIGIPDGGPPQQPVILDAEHPSLLPDVADTPIEPCATRSTQRLRDASLELIQKALQASAGNVSLAAERLGVSRGLIYRRLRSASPPTRPDTA